jgi:hypothetical protein
MNMKNQNQDLTDWMINKALVKDELAEIAELEVLASADLERERAKWYQLVK